MSALLCAFPAVNILIAAAVVRWRVADRVRHFDHGRQAALCACRCPACGYDLRGTPAPRCPECAETFDEDEWDTVTRSAASRA